MSGYPIVLDGERLEALVVGGGDVGARKTRALLESGASVRVVTRAVGDALRALASSSSRLTIAEREYEAGDIGDALLVVAATHDRATNARVASDARARRRLVNVADAPDEGNCVTAATLRAGELVVAVGAGGVPAVAARVRDALATRLDDRYADAVSSLGSLRRTLLARGERDRWRRAVAELVDEGFCESVERGAFGERVRAWH